MKRFRVLNFDFDTRVLFLTQEMQQDWDVQAKEMHRQNKERVERRLIMQFGETTSEQNKQNFIDLGPKSFSILAFHNKFFEQVRKAFIIGSYYPALTGACALGERILNHLVLKLRNDFKESPEYKNIYSKDSFDNWKLLIDTLESWKVLLPEVTVEFRRLKNRRNDAVHFRPETDQNDRALALEAIKNLDFIIGNQFCGFGPQPWFITSVPGEAYIKKDWERNPFIKSFYIPNCLEIGPNHVINSLVPLSITDTIYADCDITDEEFSALRISHSS